MSAVSSKIEAILFLSGRPVSFRKLSMILDIKENEVLKGLEELKELKNTDANGVHLIVGDAVAELATNPAYADILISMSKEETEGILTRPQLETLTIIAYRGPISKVEVEHIRGVNCTIILRNLLMRGLIIVREDDVRLQKVYTLSTEMLRHLGLHSAKELPDYDELHTHAKIDEMLDALFNEVE